MGSFNEICALSGLPISYNDEVRLLFLTRNPYIEADQHESQRGCYHYEQWFLRNPPIKGKYDDYGRCDFGDNAISRLVNDVFQGDVVERPFGFNRYHAGDVTKAKGIHHFLHAAWQGRLLVKDFGSNYWYFRKGEKKPPIGFPSWEKIHSLLKEAGLPLQLDSNDDSGQKGFNAQPVIDGLVCVTWNSYSNEEENLDNARKLLENYYECHLAYEHEPKGNPCLMVAPLGASDNPSILDAKVTYEEIEKHPSSRRMRGKRESSLPVLAVMVLEDVWQEYCNIDIADGYRDALSVSDLAEKIREAVKGVKDGSLGVHKAEIALRGVFTDIPFQTMIGTHLDKCLESDKYSDSEKEEVLQACAEAARVEVVMGILHQAWHIPSLGGQINEWEIRAKLLDSMAGIARKRIKEELEFNGGLVNESDDENEEVVEVED